VPATGLLLAPSLPAKSKGKDAKATLIWSEGKTGCTFERGEDGKYRWGMWDSDLGIVIAVDSQELQKSRRRHEPAFAMEITFRYRGRDALDVRNDNLTLEYVDHAHETKSTLDPDELSTKLQADADELNDEIARELRKHPEKSSERNAQLQLYAKEVTEMQEFLAVHSLRPATLDAANPELRGWVFFSTKSKWIGDWKKRENFILRVPFPGRVYEFPFSLPPIEGDLILRKRGD
jgi:hypothetical protein